MVRDRYPTFQERRNSLQSNSLDCPSYAVDLYFRSLVKYRQESQIPPPTWRGPPKEEGSQLPPQDSPIHIQLPQPVTDTYKLVYISHQARRDSDSGEHSPADSQGVDILSGPALRKAHSLEHLDFEAVGGPESREHSPAKLSGTTLQGPACSLKSSIAHSDNPAHGGPDSRDRSTANPLKGVDSSTHVVAHSDNPARGGPDSRDRSTAHLSGLKILQMLLKVSHLNKEVTTLQKHLQQHYLYPPPEVNLKSLKLN